jgi:hypothetical protein
MGGLSPMAPEFHRVVPPAAERAGYHRTARTRTVVVRLGPGHNIGNAGGLEREDIAPLVHDTTGRSVIAGLGLGRLKGADKEDVERSITAALSSASHSPGASP